MARADASMTGNSCDWSGPAPITGHPAIHAVRYALAYAGILVLLICLASPLCLGGPKKVGGKEKIFAEPGFWVAADSLYGDYGGAYWLREKKNQIQYEGGNWVTSESYHLQILVLDEKKMEGYADVSLAFGPSSRIVDLKARAITSDGTVFEVEKSQVFEKSLVPGFMLYSERMAKVFAMPGYCDHCILDIAYTIKNEGPYLSDEFVFGQDVPVHLAKYSYAVDPMVFRAGLEVFYKCYNFTSIPREETYENPNGRILQWMWEVNDIHAFPREDWMPPRERVIPRILLASGRRGEKEADWDSWVKWYRELMIDFDKPYREIHDLTESVVADSQSERARIQSIADVLGKEIRYVAVGLADTEWKPHDPKTVLETKYGDCKDMSMLAIAMLKEAGIKAYPALLLTKTQGDIDKQLRVPRFNHMIVHIEGKDSSYWFDPTAAPCPLGYLPYVDRDTDALLVAEGGALWERTPAANPFPSAKGSTTLITHSTDGSVTATIRLRYDGDLAGPMVRDLNQLGKEDLQKEIEDQVKSCVSGVTLASCEVVTLKESPPRVVLAAQYQKPSAAVRIEDRMAMKLDFMSSRALDLADLGVTKERKYPLWFPYPWTECDTICIEGPSGWTPDRVPDGIAYRGGCGSCDIGYSETSNQIIVTRRSAIDAGLIGPGDFDDFLGFWRRARERATREIVFRKM